jgi:hypothetical protein
LSQLVTLSKKITDYNAEDDIDLERKEDEEVGIAVVFDDEDRDGEDDEGFEIREESDEKEEEQGDGKNHWNIVEWTTKSVGVHFLLSHRTWQ